MTLTNRFAESPDPRVVRSWHLDDDYGISYDTYTALYHEFNEIVRSVCRDNNVMLIDLARVILSDSQHLYSDN
jgi:hypothetical protein